MKTTDPKAPDKTRIYAIGDVHGRRDLLNQMFSIITNDVQGDKNDAQDRGKIKNVVVMLGDYIDRGPDSSGVLDQLDNLKQGLILPGFEVHLLKGNHEDTMLSFLADKDPYTWLGCGGNQTLASYGFEENAKNLRARFLKALPRHHKDLLRTLKNSLTLGDYGFAHAGVKPHVAWSQQDPNDLLWIRSEFLDSTEDFGIMVVHGHSANSKPVQRKNRIGIDTRAWESGILTCVVLENAHRRFLST